MTFVERMIRAGLLPDSAADNESWFRLQGDAETMEDYAREVESGVSAVQRQSQR